MGKSSFDGFGRRLWSDDVYFFAFYLESERSRLEITYVK